MIAHTPDVVPGDHLSRLARHTLLHLSTLEELRSKGVRVEWVADGLREGVGEASGRRRWDPGGQAAQTTADTDRAGVSDRFAGQPRSERIRSISD